MSLKDLKQHIAEQLGKESVTDEQIKSLIAKGKNKEGILEPAARYLDLLEESQKKEFPDDLPSPASS